MCFFAVSRITNVQLRAIQILPYFHSNKITLFYTELRKLSYELFGPMTFLIITNFVSKTMKIFRTQEFVLTSNPLFYARQASQ